MGAVGMGACFTRLLENAPKPGDKAGATAVRMALVAGIVGSGRAVLLPYGGVGGSPLHLPSVSIQFKD